jgi:hypothetical protein
VRGICDFDPRIDAPPNAVYRRAVCSARKSLVLSALVAVGCASLHEPQRSPDGLVRTSSWKPGNLFAHPTRSIDDYDDIWVAEIGLHYADGQEPLADSDANRIRRMMYDTVLERFPVAGQLTARAAGPCTLRLGVYLAALEFPGSDAARKRRSHNGAATVVFELRDSQSNEPLVRYGQRRELDSGGLRRASTGPDLDRFESALRTALDDVGLRMHDALPVNATGARTEQGCQGTVGEVRARNKSPVR